MNQIKNNTGWILCPSKSFPGKFYYFNVLNGETAWSLNEIENNSRKDFNIHRISDKEHCYPEPNSPPQDDNTSSSTIPQVYKKPDFFRKDIIPPRCIFNNINQTQSPVFGQAVFPKYVSNVEPYNIMPNIIWTPIPMPMQAPMYMRNTTELKQGVNRTSMPFVQACNIPLSKRFSKYYKKDMHNFNVQKNKCYNTSKPVKNRKETPTFSPAQIIKQNVPNSKSFIKESVFKRRQTQSESNVYINPEVLKPDSLDGVINFDRQLTDNSDSRESLANELAVSNLDCDDLRLLLLAKRRKSVDADDLGGYENNAVVSKKIKTSKDEQAQAKTPKKRVTFNLQEQTNSGSSDAQVECNMSPQEQPKYSKLQLRMDWWYVVVDPDTLIDDYEFIEEYVKSDAKCRLLLPRIVQSNIEAMCVGDCQGRQRVIVARQLARKLRNPPSYIVPLPDIEDTNNIAQEENYIIKCCLLVVDSGNKAVLLTNSTNLYTEGIAVNLNCFQLKYIKANFTNATPKVSFDFKKVKINAPKPIPQTNMFLKHPSGFEPYSDREKLRANSYKRSIFDDIEQNTEQKCVLEVKKVDANTSPITNEKFMEITRKNYYNFPQIYNENANSATTIGINIEKLHIKDSENEMQTFENKLRAVNQKQITVNVKQKSVNEKEKSVSDRQNAVNQKKITLNEKQKSVIEKQKSISDRHNAANQKQITLNEKQKSVNEKQKSISDRHNAVNQKQNGVENLANTFEFQKANVPKSFSQIQTEKVLSDNISYKSAIKDSSNDASGKYDADSNLLVERIKLRMEEWLCTFTQILEDALTRVLNKRNAAIEENFEPPWVLFDVIEAVVRQYETDKVVNAAAYDLNSTLLSLCSKIGKFKSSMTPTDFMQLFELGLHLIQTLKLAHPTYTELEDAETSLTNLFSEIEKPGQDNETMVFHPPVLSRSEVEIDTRARHNFLKKPSDIIDYLKKHFPDWKSYEPPLKQQSNEKQIEQNITGDMKIVRTFGRNLKLLNLACNKSITIKDPIEENLKAKHGIVNVKIKQSNKDSLKTTIDEIDLSVLNCNTGKEKNSTKVLREFENSFSRKCLDDTVILSDEDFHMEKAEYRNTVNKEEPKLTRKINNDSTSKSNNQNATSVFDLNIPKHANTFDDGEEKAGPKVVRNIRRINAFEEKVKENQKKIDMNAIDYETNTLDTETVSSILVIDNDNAISINDSASFVYEIRNVKHIQNNDNLKNNDSHVSTDNDDVKISEVASTIKCESDSVNVNPNIKDDSTNDSGFENESLYAHCLVKTFLTELSSSFKMIHKFIDNSISGFREDEIHDDKKRLLHAKTNRTHLIVAEIIDKLKSIIERECNDSTTLKAMLIKAGVHASTDKRMTRYRQVVTKCLEQAQTLKTALKIMLCVTDEDYNASVSAVSLHSNRYFNIFE